MERAGPSSEIKQRHFLSLKLITRHFCKSGGLERFSIVIEVSPEGTLFEAKHFQIVAEDLDLAPDDVMRDNDTKFTKQFDAVIESSDAKIKRNTPLSPNLRAHVERFIQTLKVECLDKFVIVAERHLNYVCREFSVHYNRERPHEACGHLPPASESSSELTDTVHPCDIVCTTRLGGSLKSYSRRAV